MALMRVAAGVNVNVRWSVAMLVQTLMCMTIIRQSETCVEHTVRVRCLEQVRSGLSLGPFESGVLEKSDI